LERIKVIITGASGKVGEAIAKTLGVKEKYKLYLFSSSKANLINLKDEEVHKFDITDAKELKAKLKDIEPDIIINCTALTNVDRNEDDKNLSQRLNVGVVKELAKYCKLFDKKMISFSTDYIFSGNEGPYAEDASTLPVNYYGKTKLQSEILLATELKAKQYAIIRTNVVYGISNYGQSDFVNWIIGELKNKREINIVEGQYCNPTYTFDLAKAVEIIIEEELSGIFHVGGEDYLNRYEIAMKVAEVFDCDKNLINKIANEQLVQKARRPEKGGLIIENTEAKLNMKFYGLVDGLNLLKKLLELNAKN